jgi:uroporphyrin-3 C-methyltransferase
MNQPDNPPGPDPDSTQSVTPLPKRSRWPAVLAGLAILALLGTVAVGHFYWQSLQARFAQLQRVMETAREQQRLLADRVEETAREFAAQEQRLREQEQAIRRQTEGIAVQKQKLAQQEEAVRQSLENLQQSVVRTGQGWRAAEAAYLLELAQRRLTLEADVGTAIKALTAAAERLRETGDPRWVAVQERIAEDIARLRPVPTLDRAALSKTLLRMASGVEHLPLRSRRTPPSPGAESERPAGQRPRSLQTLLEDGLEGFRSLVRVRRDDRAGPALPGEDQHYALYQNLRLQLDSARFGLLRRDRSLYASSLDTAEAWLQTFFRIDAPETQLYLTDLAELRAVNVAPDLPDLAPTLDALQAELNAGEAIP